MMTKDEIFMGVLTKQMITTDHTSDIMIREEVDKMSFKCKDMAENCYEHFEQIGNTINSAEIEHKKNIVNETKIQLSFSVDRLLNSEVVKNKCNEQISGLNNNMVMDINNDNSHFHQNSRLIGFDCCKSFRQISDTLNNQRIQFSNGLRNLGISDDQLIDIKSIVRPTPIRMSNNVVHPSAVNLPISSTSVPSFGTFQSVLKFHQIANQMNSVNPLSSLKTLQANAIPFRSTVTQHHHSHQNSTNTGNVTTSRTTTMNQQSSNVVTMTGSQSQQQNHSTKRKRSWSRAVFSNLQRKGLEIQFQQQKYITKPDRRKLANRLNLTDAQVKVWFQNRRMKWRHTRENLKSGQEKPIDSFGRNFNDFEEGKTSSDDEDEIDVVAE